MPKLPPFIIEEIEALDHKCADLIKEDKENPKVVSISRISESGNIQAMLRLMSAVGDACALEKLTDTLIRLRARIKRLCSNLQEPGKSGLEL